MKKRKEAIMYGLWIVMYIGAVLLSLVNNVQGGGRVLIWIYAVVFFAPGAVLAVWAIQERNNWRLKMLRVISCTSLGLTLAALIANFLSVGGSAQLGRVLNGVLILVSAPLTISYNWAISLFLWACLLMITFPGVVLPREKKK